MALIKCPECGKEISSLSKMCIHCGYPIKEQQEEEQKSAAMPKLISENEYGVSNEFLDALYKNCKGNRIEMVKLVRSSASLNLGQAEKVVNIYWGNHVKNKKATVFESATENKANNKIMADKKETHYPNNGKKQKNNGCLTAVGILVLVVVLFGCFSSCESMLNSPDEPTPTPTYSPATSEVSAENETSIEHEVKIEEVVEVIEYIPVDVSEMVDLLENNALKAEKTYQDQYLEITGRLSNIDSDGAYISLYPSDNEWAFTGVQCYIQNEEHINQVLEMSVDDIITIQGQVTDIGEILGYVLDIHTIK